jgi:hypothetical protein
MDIPRRLVKGPIVFRALAVALMAKVQRSPQKRDPLALDSEEVVFSQIPFYEWTWWIE